MATRLAKSIRSTQGTTVVEFALISILLFTLLFGILEGGRVFHSWLVITNEAREGARWGAVRCVDADVPAECYASDDALRPAVVDYVVGRNGGMLTSSNVTCTTLRPDPATGEDTLTVTIQYTVEIITPLISALWPNFNLAAESAMRLE